MMNTIKLGSKVRRKHDDGWGSPGCVMSYAGNRLHIFWPDENVFTDDLPADVILYTNIALQPQEVAA